MSVGHKSWETKHIADLQVSKVGRDISLTVVMVAVPMICLLLILVHRLDTLCLLLQFCLFILQQFRGEKG